MIRSISLIGATLLGMATLLFALWFTKNTIAARNILIWSGALLTTFLFIKRMEYAEEPFFDRFLLGPIYLLLLLIFWVFLQYLMLGMQVKQLNELDGFWVRAIISLVFGCGVGYSIRRSPELLNALIIGVLLSLFILIGQYIPEALEAGRLLKQNFHGYIYQGKVHPVFITSLALYMVLGNYLDTNSINKNYLRLKSLWILLYMLVAYIYIYVVDSRNGIILLEASLVAWFIVYLSKHCKKYRTAPSRDKIHSIITPIILCACIAITWGLHTKNNVGWKNFIEDFQISIQIDKYKNWQSTGKFGFPKNSSGLEVASNTYQRISWAIVAMRSIGENSLGHGVINRPLERALSDKNLKDFDGYWTFSSHSGILDFGLAYGWPGLLLLFGAFICLVVNSYRSKAYNKFVFTSNFAIISIFLSMCIMETDGVTIECLYFIVGMFTFVAQRPP